MNLAVIILAAGQGKRMHSDWPKVLHPVGGRPMLAHVLQTARALTREERITIVHGQVGDTLRQALDSGATAWCLQAEQWGTGHAVAQALPALPNDATVLVLYADVPLVTVATLSQLVASLEGRSIALLSVRAEDPGGYGRIVRDDQDLVRRIVEDKDANAAVRAVKEVNTGILAARAADLRRWLAAIGNDNAQGEYYLTDCVERAVREGGTVRAQRCPDSHEVMGVNDKQQLAAVERAYQRRQAARLMEQGVTVLDPERLDIRGELACGRDVVLDVNVILEGRVSLGDNVAIGAHSLLRDSVIDSGTRVEPYSLVDSARIGRNCRIGPFARIRPDTRLDDEVHIGNFVEVKKSNIARHSKVNHLSYIGDTDMGARVNVGAGTITCNYDGAAKHKTRIGDDVFIGSNTQLVAPVSIEAGATIGAGSTITRDAPAGELTLSRMKQSTLKGWRRPTKKP